MTEAGNEPQPFTVDIPQERIAAILERVESYPWADIKPLAGWTGGTNVSVMRELADYWITAYDWRKTEADLNRFPQFMAHVEGRPVHFMHIRGSAPRPRPLLLLHGWPGSILEFLDVIERLAWPERFGGNMADGFDIVVPSIPGFGFSQAADKPVGPRKVAEIFATLMVDILGYESFIAQGGDWGSAISAWLAHDHPHHCRAIHLNMALALRGDVPFATDKEKAYLERRGRVMAQEGAYALLQGTKPQSLAFAMVDSPIGVAAWILEKFAAWTDIPRPDGEPDILGSLGPEPALSHIMYYLVTGSFQTSTWIYRGRMDEGTVHLPDNSFIDLPTGIAAFPDPVFRFPPRSLVEQSYNVVRWTDMPKGGHFAALEAPADFSSEITAFARQIEF